ncbi:ABC transporter substrate-binding protein [Salinispira pacifica]|uniref:Branched-chain amino acid ABC transporter, amino acid-binding protein n=1 Tax=Salinispira pacifica TaxID=1307761 RepID=V5WE53_9SPIO|nr:ABC transporter substrate-binding protein [Salinispira pacifica]AHC14062.1 Branched-chain amino acid ABC transporter, amino acid-binding protein [Salinispira pacifica]
MKKIAMAVILMVLVAFGAWANGTGEGGAAQGVTDSTVLVGNAAATSGALAAVGVPFNQGIEAYFSMVNQAGGVAGRTIEWVHYDDEFDGAQGLTYSQRLVEDDQIFAFVGHFGTPTVAATQEYLDTVGIPRVYYATGLRALFDLKAEGGARASFPVQPIYDAEGEVMVARAVADFGAQKIGVIYPNADDGKGLLAGIELRAGSLGVDIVASQVAPDANDMSSAAQTILSEDVDVVLVAANQVPAEVAIKALAAAGNQAPVITSYVNAAPTFVEGVQEALNSFDVYANAWLQVVDNDGNPTEALQEFESQVGEIDPALAGNPYAQAGWIAAAVFVQGLERVGNAPLTWENYIAAMEEAPVSIPLGGSVNFADGRRVGTQAMSLLKASYDDGPVWTVDQPLEPITEILD